MLVYHVFLSVKASSRAKPRLDRLEPNIPSSDPDTVYNIELTFPQRGTPLWFKYFVFNELCYLFTVSNIDLLKVLVDFRVSEDGTFFIDSKQFVWF